MAPPTLVAASAWAASAAAPAPTYPTNAIGDRILAFVQSKPDTITVATPAGWTYLADVASFINIAQAIDAGDSHLYAFYRDVSSVLSGTQTFTVTGGNSSGAFMQSWRPAAGEQWGSTVPSALPGSDINANTSWSPTGMGSGFDPVAIDDVIISVGGIPTDGVTWSAWDFTVLNATVTTVHSPATDLASATGQDVGGSAWYGTVTALPGGTPHRVEAPIAFGSGLTSSFYGPALMVRLRDQAIPAASNGVPHRGRANYRR